MAPRHVAAFGDALLALAAPIGITGADPDSRTTWIHVAPFGEWNGHSEGSFSLTADHFRAICAQVRSKQTPVSLDYEHASIRPSGGPTPAAGYVLATEVRDDGLYALVEFTPRAAEMIKGGEYRFCSGVFDFAAKDNASGEELLCALDTIALTNRPFIDGQNPIALSRRIPLSSGAPMKIQIADLIKLLKSIDTGDGLTADQLSGAISLLGSGQTPPDAKPDAAKADASRKVPLSVDAPAVALSEVTAQPPAAAAGLADAPPPAPMPMSDPMPAVDAAAGDPDGDGSMDDVDAQLMAATGLDIDGLAAAIAANMDAVVALLMGTAPDASSMALSKDLVIKGKDAVIFALTKERNELQSERNARLERDSAAEVDALIKRAPSLADRRTDMLALARTAPKEFRSMAAALAPMSVDLTRPHASAMAAPKSGSEQLTVLDDHPLIAATRASLENAPGLTPEVRERALNKVRERIANGGN